MRPLAEGRAQPEIITADNATGWMDQVNMTTGIMLGIKKGFCTSNGPLCFLPVNTVLPARLAKDRANLACQALAAALMSMIHHCRLPKRNKLALMRRSNQAGDLSDARRMSCRAGKDKQRRYFGWPGAGRPG